MCTRPNIRPISNFTEKLLEQQNHLNRLNTSVQKLQDELVCLSVCQSLSFSNSLSLSLDHLIAYTQTHQCTLTTGTHRRSLPTDFPRLFFPFTLLSIHSVHTCFLKKMAQIAGGKPQKSSQRFEKVCCIDSRAETSECNWRRLHGGWRIGRAFKRGRRQWE